MDKIYKKIVFSNMSPETFMAVVIKGLFKTKDCPKEEKSKQLFYELVEEVGDINVKNAKGKTLLMSYVLDDECKFENVKFLIENGADVNIKDSNKINVLHYAVATKETKSETNLLLFKYFIEKGAELTDVLTLAPVELIFHVINGRTDSVQNVIDEKLESNRDILEESLFFAVLFNQEEIVLLLLENAVDPNYKLGGWSPIFVAARFNYKNVLEALLQKCTEDDLKDALFRLSRDSHFCCVFCAWRQLSGFSTDRINKNINKAPVI